MLPTSPPTGYARLTPNAARAVLLGLVGVCAFLVAVSVSPRAIVNPGKPDGRSVGDPALYRAEAERVDRGESYYDVLAEELPARGYPTRSVFNWRTQHVIRSPMNVMFMSQSTTGAIRTGYSKSMRI